MAEMHNAPSGRKQVRAPIREGEVKLRPGEYQGRNGEVLKRTPFKFGNKYDFPDEVKEPGWSYQWITHSVYNNTEFSELPVMKRAGWREVHPDSLKGYFREMTPEGQSHIWMDGMILVERPQGMTDDAKREALALANKHFDQQVNKIYDETARLPDGYRAMRGEFEREAPQAAPQSWKPTHRPRPMDVEE